MKRLSFFPIIIAFLVSGNALAFDHEITHRKLTEKAIENSLANQYLIDNHNLPEGKETLINGDKIEDWITEGSYLEDKPPCRASNHFHNPLKDWTESYMSDQTWYINWWCSSGEYPPQNINSAVHWATGYTAPAPGGLKEPTGNQWDWDHAREHYYTYLTGRDFQNNQVADTREKREEYFAKCFQGLGQVLHLVQDMAVPAHVRNDFKSHLEFQGITEETLIKPKKWFGDKFEYYVEYHIKEHLSGSIGGELPESSLTKFWDADIYTGQDPDTINSQVIGLSEYTNMNFGSWSTIFAESLPVTDEHYHPYPKKESTDVQSYIESGKIPETITDEDKLLVNKIYIAKTGDGEKITHFATPSYLTRYIHDEAGFVTKEYLRSFQIDDDCAKDYAELLIPRAVGYSAGLLDYFFRGDMDIRNAFIQRGDGMSIRGISFEVINATPPVEVWQTVEPFRSGFLDLSYQYIPQGQSEHVLGLVKGVYAINGADDPINSEFVPVNIVFPAGGTIPEGATDLSFMLVFQGRLGNEAGAVAARTFDYSMHSRIAYHHQPGGFGNVSNIYTVLPDGTDTREITATSSATPSNSLYFYSPAWSPDGTKLAFVKESCTDPDPYYEEGIYWCGDQYYSQDIVVIDLNSDESYPDNVLTTLHAEVNSNIDLAYMPSFSPDGNQIAAILGDGYLTSLIIFDLNTGAWRYLKNYENFLNSAPTWSPKGDSIAYSSEERIIDPVTQETIGWSSDIYLINPDDGGEIRLTNDDYNDLQPAWSPDGERIVFVSDRDGGGWTDLWTMDKTGGDMHRILDCSTGCSSPSFSPDGKRIAFIQASSNIYTIALDGSGLRQVTITDNLTACPAWSPFLPEEVSISASPVSIRPGESSTLTWYSINADSYVIGPGIGNVSASGSITVSPSETTTYTITVTGPGWTASASAVVTVESPRPTVTINTSADSIKTGESVALSWSSTEADTCVIEPGIGCVSANGSITVSPSETKTYTITATGPGGTATDSVMVVVNDSTLYIIKITETDTRTGIAGERIENPLQVMVLNQDLMPVEHALVTFIIKAGGGKFDNNETQIKTETDSEGIASAYLTLGEKTSANPAFRKINPEDKYATQAGKNIVDANISGTSILSPFIAYGYPGDPDRIIKAFGDGAISQPNCPAGTLRVIVADSYDNPISNQLLTFTALPAESKNPDAPLPDGLRNIEFYREEDCAGCYPIFGDCETHKTISRKTEYFGAMINTILGNTSGTKYTVEITSGNIPPVYFYVYSQGALSADIFTPPQMFIKYLQIKGKDGEPVNAANAGKDLNAPLKSRLLMSYPEYRVEGPYTATFPDNTRKEYWKIRNRGIVNTEAVSDGTVEFIPVQGGGSVTPTGNSGNGEYSTIYTTGPDPALNIIEARGEAMVSVPEVFAGSTIEAAIIYTPTPVSREVVLKSGEQVAFEWDTGEPVKTGAQNVTYTVYGVDIKTGPGIAVSVNPYGLSEEAFNIEYEILPSEYQAAGVHMTIYKKTGNEEPVPVYVVNTSTQGKGYATVPNGFPFDLDPEVSYYAQAVLNNGTEAEIRSERIELVPVYSGH
ncbi:MAG TPA: hypothetical protein PK874_01920 [Desulfobacteraceae bacterium]|nr:hypothetical protein [Desulfobacteraceae bacterium]HPJ68273.1 hypothetical protein [Desulfobacteraceae bacterium]HPQ27934.1 hypothetical protein [Desulfobacteraceae bacterium]